MNLSLPIVCAPRRLCAPSFVRPWLLSSLMASLAASLFALSLLACPATAQTHGTFQTTYSGGSVTAKVLSGSGGPATCSNTPQVTQFSPGSYGPDTGSASVSASTDSNGGTNQCSAQIVNSPLTAAFTWTPDPSNPQEPAPSCAILTQTCRASWSFGKDSTSTASGSGPSNGLSNGVVTPPGSDPNNQSSVSSSTLYSAWPGSSASVSPSAGFSGTSGPGYSHPGLSGSVSATYSASVTPVFVNIGGTYNPSANDYRVLTGQQITATMIGIPSNFTVIKYTWAGLSGTCFKTYNEKATSNQLTPLGSTDTSGPASGSKTVAGLAFYDSAQENLTVTCTVTVLAPDGTSLNLTATSPTVNVLKPTAIWTTNSGDPTVGPLFSQSGMGYAERWNAGITVPSPFSGGMGCFAQTVTPSINFQRSPMGNQSINCYMEESYINANGTSSYQMPVVGLDTNFPYQYSASQLYAQGYMWNASTSAGSSGDAPSILFSIPAADNGGNNWYSASATDSFTTWLMYQPPSGVWVPLQTVTWNWSGNVVKNKATGTWNSATNGSPAVTGYTSDSGTPTNSPPQWNCVNVGASVLYPLY